MHSAPHSAAIIIPAYRSEQTIEASLVSMTRQAYPSTQVVVVESDPGGRIEELIRLKFPSVRYIPSKDRLLPHAARNLGAQNSSADLLLFTDPDIYAPPEWVAGMVSAHEKYGGVIAGSLDNATHRWLDWGLHLGKFDVFLPMGQPRRTAYCATGNMLCTRGDFERVGGFDDEEMLGDLLISWKFTEAGIPITFVPEAVVRHHHIQDFPAYLQERYRRGRDFGRLRRQRFHWSAAATAAHLLLTLSGLRLLRLLIRTGVNAWHARRFGWFIAALPVLASGQSAWLLGEAREYLG